MKKRKKKKTLLILAITLALAIVVFVWEEFCPNEITSVVRNGVGQGKKEEAYKLTIEGEETEELFSVEVEEQQYTYEETRKMFQEITKKLDEVVLGDNDSFDRVEKDLNFVTTLEEYPVQIQWQMDTYTAIDLSGKIQEEYLTEEGTLVEIRGTILYGEEQCTYIRSVRVYPLTRTGMEKILYDIQKEVEKREEKTREKDSFSLPKEVDGKKLSWSQNRESRWGYVLLAGFSVVGFVMYREREKRKQKEKRRREELLLDYPTLVSKFTMLLSTGCTMKSAWGKVLEHYEDQKEITGRRIVYEEMIAASHQMQSGVSEGEAYEQFGKRCGLTVYLKFGALLSQNLRKGSKGLSDLLRIEAIQSFENRKSVARRKGEEAGTKLLVPMLGMLTVVLIMVLVPAFLAMQL